MTTFRRRMGLILVPSVAALLLGGCAGPGYYGGDPYGPDEVVYVDYGRPNYYQEVPYYYGGRYYTGGRYETGRYQYNGRPYSNRYYYNGQYMYGGVRQTRPSRPVVQNPPPNYPVKANPPRSGAYQAPPSQRQRPVNAQTDRVRGNYQQVNPAQVPSPRAGTPAQRGQRPPGNPGQPRPGYPGPQGPAANR